MNARSPDTVAARNELSAYYSGWQGDMYPLPDEVVRPWQCHQLPGDNIVSN